MTDSSTIQKFEPGDILASATLLNVDGDDHAGDGRIIQYDSDLNEKGVLWTEGTTHLVGGLKFSPDLALWAFDSQSFTVLRYDLEGTPLPVPTLPKRSFSNANFLPDGSVLLGEHLVGDKVNLPPERPLGTALPKMPGSDRFGDGHVFRFDAQGSLLNEYATETHGGMGGFLGVTSSVLCPDARTLVYMSELGNRLFRYDIVDDEQLPDLVTYAPDSGDMVISVALMPDGGLMIIRANFQKGFSLVALDNDGEAAESWDLPGPGWATLIGAREPGMVYLGNFFSGTVAKFDLSNGQTVASAETGVQRSLAGLVRCPG